MDSQSTFVPEDFYCPISGDLMVTPMSDPEGHTYEKSEIETWLSQKQISPMTRSPLMITDLTENIAMKRSIETIRDKLREDQLRIKSRIHQEEKLQFVSSLNEIQVNTFVSLDNNLLIDITMPEVAERESVDIVVCLDVSGSMGEEAKLRQASGERSGNGFSILSLTRYATNAILKTLRDGDRFSLVTFTSEAKVMIPLTECTDINKPIIIAQLDELKPLSSTNLWDGIHKSMEELRKDSPPEKLKGIFVFTDGVPNIEPPRGHEGMLDAYFRKNSRCMINTYGFGYHIKSELLDDISKISGGTYSFIPDSGILANILIQGVSNFYTTAFYNPHIEVTLSNGLMLKQGEKIDINSIQYGQDRHIMVGLDTSRMDTPQDAEQSIKVTLELGGITKEASHNHQLEGKQYIEQECRKTMIHLIEGSIHKHKYGDMSYRDNINEFIKKVNSDETLRVNEYCMNLVNTFESQVREALNMTAEGTHNDWFTKWGKDYLLSLACALENEVCNNFKDKAVSNFGGTLFNRLRDEMDTIFETLEPPKQDVVQSTYGRGGYRQPIYRGHAGRRTVAVPQQPVDMRSYNTAGGACCAEGSLIKMADSTYKKVEDIKKGDNVFTKLSDDTSEIECVVKTKCKDDEFLVKINDLTITPYHPIIVDDSWTFPIKHGRNVLQKCPYLYSFVIKNRKPVVINDYIFATFGHNLKGDVIGHDYFGTDGVIDDLKEYESYKDGVVCLTKDMIHRNEKGVYKICE